MRYIILFALLVMLGISAAQIAEGFVGGLVYEDLNENGEWDQGEHGVPFINVNVVDKNNTIVASTTTDEDGEYRTLVNCIREQPYSVEPGIPSTMVSTTAPLETFTCLDGFDIYSEFGVVVLRCTTNDDCDSDRLCSEGFCIPLGCSAGYVAVDHECVPEGECYEDEDCPVGERCLDGDCIPVVCPIGYVMEGHGCVPGPLLPEEECMQDTECKLDEVCTDSSCVQIVCPVGYTVENHTCVYLSVEIPEEEPEEEEEVPEEEVPEEEKPPEEIPEEELPEVPEENVTIGVPEEVPEEGISDVVWVALILAVAAVVIVYILVYKKEAI